MFCVNNKQNSKNIALVKHRDEIPVDDKDFDDRSLVKCNSLGMGSEDRSEILNLEDFNDQSLQKYNSLDFSMGSKDLLEILKFADLEDFNDQSLQKYNSFGLSVRSGDILEILRCFERVRLNMEKN